MQRFDMSKRLLAEYSVPDVYQDKGKAPPLAPPSVMIPLAASYSSLHPSILTPMFCVKKRINETASEQNSAISLLCAVGTH